MPKPVTFFISILFSFNLTLGQSHADYYVAISKDSTQGGRLKFISDTTVELSSIPRHMFPSIKRVYKYTTTDTTIVIHPDTIIENRNNKPEGLYVQDPLKSKLTLSKIKGGFIDYSKPHIYVRQKDFPKKSYMTYCIEGKFYKQDMGKTDGYGLVRKRPKTNKALRRKLKAIDIDNFTIEIVRGLAAYERFGIDKVYGGVIVINPRK
jgi:hypothetical protein